MRSGPVQHYEYVVWFRDPARSPDDEDYEWPAVFIVATASAEQAQSWGDHLAKDRAARAGEIFLCSTVEPYVPEPAPPRRRFRLPWRGQGEKLPVVPYGVAVSDNHIGW